MTTTNASDTPGVFAPPPLIALAAVVLGLALDWLWPVSVLRDHVVMPARLVVGGALIGAGAALAMAAERSFHRIGTNAPPWKPALKLASEGVYAHIRNPMYASGVILLAGLSLALASVWMLAMLVAAALVLHYGVVKREERYLEAKFGADYRAFKMRVPRYCWRL